MTGTQTHMVTERTEERGKREGIRELRVRWGSDGEITEAGDDG